MNILLISPAYSNTQSAEYFPLGMAYISSFLKSQNLNVECLNFAVLHHSNRFEKLHKLILSKSIDLIGIGGLSTAIINIEETISYIRRHFPQISIVVGGNIITADPENMFHHLQPDFAVLGEGELIFTNLINALIRRSDLESIDGIVFRKNSRLINTGNGPTVKKLDTLPKPDYHAFGMADFLALKHEHNYGYHETRFNHGRAIPILASRSCPYRCTFCYHPGMGTYRCRNIVDVVDEMQTLHNEFRSNSFNIMDDLLSAKKSRLMQLCRELLARNLDYHWTCQIRVDHVDQELLNLMKRAGCYQISYGFESANLEVLESMNKRINPDQIAHAVAVTRNAKISIQANFLFGDPAENNETLDESIQFQEKHNLNFVDWSAIIPYPGSIIYKQAIQRKLICNSIEFTKSLCNVSSYLWNNLINLTQLPDAEFRYRYLLLRELNDLNHRKEHAHINTACITGPSASNMDFSCPNCDHRIVYDIVYPPECRHGKANLNTPIGVQGLNIVCPHCQNKMHIAANRIPHIGKYYEKFQTQINNLVETNTPVVLLPDMDRYYSVFSQDINLQGLNIQGTLDERELRYCDPSQSTDVEKLNQFNTNKYLNCHFIILPWFAWQQLKTELMCFGINESSILCWNEFFLPINASENRESSI